MKLTALFLIAVCLHVSATGFGQKVTISGKDMSLEKVFSIIKKQTGYACFYSYDMLQGVKNVSLDMKEAEVEEVMKACLWNQGLDYSITGKQITIIRRKEEISKPAILGGDKAIKVYGIVYNESGQPLTGANVTIKATGKGTFTNAKGEFELRMIQENTTLIISFIGYAAQEVQVMEGRTLQVYLNITKNELDKVVIQAYGNTSQRLATGNIVTVSKEQIERQPVMNVLSTLQGRVPGLDIKQTNGYASAPFKAEIRGRSEVGGRVSEPLYIIDGVPLTVLESSSNGGNYLTGSKGFIQNGFSGPAGGQSPLFSINPADVESISVLKDADATAIYGSRGANGVILITTKRGRPGKTKMDMNVYHGSSLVTGRYKTLNTQQYLSMRREAFYNDSIAYGITPNGGNAYDLITWDTTRYTDLQKQLWGGVGKTTDIQAGITGGDKLTTFRVGGSYHHEKNILNFTGADQRASIQFNLTHKSLNQRLNLSFTSQYSYTRSNLVSFPANVATIAPNAPAFLDATGKKPNYEGWQPVPDQVDAFGSLFQPYEAKTGFLNSQLKLRYTLIKGLEVSTSLGYSSAHSSQNQIQPISSKNPMYNPKGSSSFGNNNNQNAIIEPELDYNGVIGKGKLNVLVGGSLQTVSQDGNTIVGTGYVNDNLLWSISNAPAKTATDNFAQYKYVAAFGRINYNWADKYILNLSARRDGSSKFGSGKQFGNFWAIGTAWIFTEEPWLKNSLSFLSFGKLRTSYGITGSDNIGDYGYLSSWSSSTTFPYQNSTIPAYLPLGHANPDLQWQVNKKLEAALSLGFLKDRINLDFVWYRNRCSNQLLYEPLSSITGFTVVEENLPATVQNQGIEIQLRTKLLEKNDFDWSFNFNIGVNKNKLVAYANIDQSPYAGTYIIGQSLNITRMLHYTGVNPLTGEYTFYDKNHDGLVNANPNDTANDLFNKDLSIKFSGGFGTDFRYKAWQLNLLFAFVKQTLPSAIYSSIPGAIGNFSTVALNHWKKPGDKAEFARYTTQSLASDSYFGGSDGVYSNGSYVRLRNVSISYDLPIQWMAKAGVSACRIYARGENLFILTKYRGIDPDTPGFGAMPPAKIFTGGIQFSF